MNRTTMVIWGILIFSICGFILYLGYTKVDQEQVKISTSLVSATKKYVKDKKMEPKISQSVKIYIEDLVNEQYINKEDIEDDCIESVVYSNELLKDEIIVNSGCKNLSN